MKDLLVLLLLIVFFTLGLIGFNYLDLVIRKRKEEIYIERKNDIGEHDY